MVVPKARSRSAMSSSSRAARRSSRSCPAGSPLIRSPMSGRRFRASSSRRLFREGSVVRQGQTLYQIDPSIYAAQQAQAAANLQSARASAVAARTRPRATSRSPRWRRSPSRTIPTRSPRRGRPTPPSRRTARRCARRRSTCASPGCRRRSAAGSACRTSPKARWSPPIRPIALATITRLDPVYVDIQQSAADLLETAPGAGARRRGAGDRPGPAEAARRLRLRLHGTVEFSEVIVDQGTGTVTIRARFPNPQSILLPGMYRDRRSSRRRSRPRRSWCRSRRSLAIRKGNATLFVVGPGNRAVQRTVVADRTQGTYWVVTGGLAPGEKVITQGTANLKDGAPIKPVPASAPQRVKVPPPGATKTDARRAASACRRSSSIARSSPG